jgi:hypothetical protein
MVVVGLVFLVLVALLYVARRRRRLRVAFLFLGLLGAVLWLLSLVAIETDYRDADGTFDCWPHCTAFQDSVGAAIFWIPAVLGALAIVAGLIVAVDRARASRGHGPTTGT